MSLTRKERIEALGLLVKQDFAELAELVRSTRNLPNRDKVEVMYRLVQVAALPGRVELPLITKRKLDEVVEILGEETASEGVTPIRQTGSD